ncbi:unnamed protein product, partial [marine sediment metagenome]
MKHFIEIFEHTIPNTDFIQFLFNEGRSYSTCIYLTNKLWRFYTKNTHEVHEVIKNRIDGVSSIHISDRGTGYNFIGEALPKNVGPSGLLKVVHSHKMTIRGPEIYRQELKDHYYLYDPSRIVKIGEE